MAATKTKSAPKPASKASRFAGIKSLVFGNKAAAAKAAPVKQAAPAKKAAPAKPTKAAPKVDAPKGGAKVAKNAAKAAGVSKTAPAKAAPLAKTAPLAKAGTPAKAAPVVAPAKAAPLVKAPRATKSRSIEDVCREVACEGLATSAGYCRLHYIKNWKKIKRKELILKEGKLNQFIEELVAKYPEKYIEAIRTDLMNDKDFAKVVFDLELDESIDEIETDSESEENVVEEIKRDFEDESTDF